MIERHHEAGGRSSSATYSDCEKYRYSLTRTWDAEGPRLLYIMLNPSKATEQQNDPTIERCERRARALGFGAFRAVNIFAWRETDPKALRKVADPIGAGNDAILTRSATDWLRPEIDMLLCGWGGHGSHLDRGAAVAGLLAKTGRSLHCFGCTKDGQPRHPLYIAYATQPTLWSAPSCR